MPTIGDASQWHALTPPPPPKQVAGRKIPRSFINVRSLNTPPWRRCRTASSSYLIIRNTHAAAGSALDRTTMQQSPFHTMRPHVHGRLYTLSADRRAYGARHIPLLLIWPVFCFVCPVRRRLQRHEEVRGRQSAARLQRLHVHHRRLSTGAVRLYIGLDMVITLFDRVTSEPPSYDSCCDELTSGVVF
jgi:hypothetical protein